MDIAKCVEMKERSSSLYFTFDRLGHVQKPSCRNDFGTQTRAE